MAFETSWIRFGANREHVGFLALPERAARPMPAIVVIQEALGVDAHIEDVSLRYAKAGYAVLAPDLYAQNGERPAPLAKERLSELQAFVNGLPPGAWGDAKVRDAEVAKRPAAEGARLSESLGAMFAAMASKGLLAPLLAATAFLRREQPATQGQKIGSVGYCLGGGLSAQLACHDPELAAAIIYYGASPAAELVPQIGSPVLGFYGGLDARINQGVPAFAAAMREAGKRFEPVTYEGVQHAFNNDNRPSYDVKAARDAFARALALFRETLA